MYVDLQVKAMSEIPTINERNRESLRKALEDFKINPRPPIDEGISVPMNLRPRTDEDWFNFAHFMRHNFSVSMDYVILINEPISAILAMKRENIQKIDACCADKQKFDRATTILMKPRPSCKENHPPGQPCNHMQMVVALEKENV